MRHFSVAPALTLKGRSFKGLRGFSGKPLHPPLTDVPIAAYLFAAVFDVLSLVLHPAHPRLGTELFHAATWTFLGGAAVSVLAALTGWADWHHSSSPGTQARRTINTHAAIMITVTVLTMVDIGVRVGLRDRPSAPIWLVALSVVIAILVSLGASFGGSLVYDYGFNVETAGDSPVWRVSEIDLRPGEKSPSGTPPVPRAAADGDVRAPSR
jgi:uncharacterized membrane protein